MTDEYRLSERTEEENVCRSSALVRTAEVYNMNIVFYGCINNTLYGTLTNTVAKAKNIGHEIIFKKHCSLALYCLRLILVRRGSVYEENS